MSEGAPTLRETGGRVKSAFAPVDEALHAIDWWPIVKKEFKDTIRSRALLILSGLFLALFVLPPAVLVYTNLRNAQALSALLVAGRLSIMSVVVPVAGIAMGYAAVAGERQSGSAKLLLSLPYDRRDVVLGKFVGRSIVLLVPLVTTIALQYLVLLPELTSADVNIELSSILIFVVMTMVVGVVFVALAVGVSAAATTTRRALAVAGGIWVYFFALWGSAVSGAGSLLREHTGMGSLTTFKVEMFLSMLNPTQAYQTLVRSLTGTTQQGQQLSTELLARTQMLGGLRGQFAAQQLQQSGGLPIYLTDPVVGLVLLAWIVVPLALGAWLFGLADL